MGRSDGLRGTFIHHGGRYATRRWGKFPWKFSGGFFVGFIPEFHLLGGNSGEFIEYIEKSWKMHHV